MTLYLAKTIQHALMALTIKKAHGNFTSQSSGYLGRTALQKIMYFLVRRGLPLDYHFDIYHYGPFCQDVYHNVEWLIADGVVRDASENQAKYSNYVPDSQMDALLEKFESQVKEHEPIVDEVVSIFAELPPEDLELIATLDYLYQEERAKQIHPPKKDTVVARFLEVKGDKFGEKRLSYIYDILAKAKIFEPDLAVAQSRGK
jgi:hypothetical protein